MTSIDGFSVHILLELRHRRNSVTRILYNHASLVCGNSNRYPTPASPELYLITIQIVKLQLRSSDLSFSFNFQNSGVAGVLHPTILQSFMETIRELYSFLTVLFTQSRISGLPGAPLFISRVNLLYQPSLKGLQSKVIFTLIMLNHISLHAFLTHIFK